MVRSRIVLLGLAAVLVGSACTRVPSSAVVSTQTEPTPPASATATRPDPSGPTTSTPIASPTAEPSLAATPTPHYLSSTANVGMNGAEMWMLSDTALSVSEDGGLNWSDVALPNGASASALLEAAGGAGRGVAVASGRAIWLAVVNGGGFRLYRRPDGASTWSTVLTVPTPTYWLRDGGLFVTITPGPAGLVTVTAVWAVSMNTALSSLYISTDDGRTFAQPRSAPDWVHDVAFVSSRSGVATTGPGTADELSFWHTSDGGATWSAASISGLPSARLGFYGAPLVVGSDIVVPITDMGAAADWSGSDHAFHLLVSHDGGATFTPMGTALPLGDATPPMSSTLGSVTWVHLNTPDIATLYETSDNGQTWKAITPSGLPAGGWWLDLTGPTSAIAEVVQNGCTGFKTGCWSTAWLMGTTDGGRTWSNL